MCMSVMEKRLQLLLDARRWELVSREAEAGHRSAASVIREAIDVYFATDEEDQRRAEAARRFLEMTAEPVADEPGRDPRQIKVEQDAEDVATALDQDLSDYLDKKLVP